MTPVQPQQPGSIDNNIRRKRISEYVNQLVNDKAFCRTAPATLGLLTRQSANYMRHLKTATNTNMICFILSNFNLNYLNCLYLF